jgi:hypothetical protein
LAARDYGGLGAKDFERTELWWGTPIWIREHPSRLLLEHGVSANALLYVLAEDSPARFAVGDKALDI